MILKIDGNINRYYVQTLCMVFFPGASFGENEEPGEGVPEVHLRLGEDENGVYTATATIKLNDKSCEASAVVTPDDELHISSPDALAAGRAIFSAGKALLGHIPPWGILTGVRPAKIAAGLLRSGNGILKSKKILRDECFLNPQKAALAISVASTEMKLLKKMAGNTCSLYISIPFCPTRCAYCSFVSYTTPRLLSLIDDYIDAIMHELDDVFATISALNMRVSTVYIGGGTPTTLSSTQLERIFEKLALNLDLFSLDEFTLEAGRPDTITAEKLAVAKKYGVTRVSVNPQTLNNKILEEIGRRHTADDFFRAYQLALDSGIRDINVDLIAGLPGDEFKSFAETIDRIIELKPTNITVHTFCVKKASDLLRNNSDIYSLSGGDVSKCVAYSQLNTKFAGYKNTVGNLENVGFSIEGHEGLYNIYMMEEVQSIFAVGAGAITKLVDYDRANKEIRRIERISNPKYPYEYLEMYSSAEKRREELIKKALEFFNPCEK